MKYAVIIAQALTDGGMKFLLGTCFVVGFVIAFAKTIAGGRR